MEFWFVLLCCWIDNIMDSSIKPLRKEILELIASSETITECVFPPVCITAHLSTMNFICHFVKAFDNVSLGIYSCKLALPCRVCSAQFISRLFGALPLAWRGTNLLANCTNSEQLILDKEKHHRKVEVQEGCPSKSWEGTGWLMPPSVLLVWETWKAQAPNQHCFFTLQNSTQMHIKTACKWTSPQRHTVCYPGPTTSFDMTWCTE